MYSKERKGGFEFKKDKVVQQKINCVTRRKKILLFVALLIYKVNKTKVPPFLVFFRECIILNDPCQNNEINFDNHLNA